MFLGIALLFEPSRVILETLPDILDLPVFALQQGFGGCGHAPSDAHIQPHKNLGMPGKGENCILFLCAAAPDCEVRPSHAKQRDAYGATH
jgi:hypothetical protein